MSGFEIIVLWSDMIIWLLVAAGIAGAVAGAPGTATIPADSARSPEEGASASARALKNAAAIGLRQVFPEQTKRMGIMPDRSARRT